VIYYYTITILRRCAMKKTLLLGVFTLGFLVVSCQQKPAEQQQQPAQQPAGEQKPAEQPKSEAKPAQATAVADAEALAKAKGCYACHDVNAKKVGPAFKDIANKYAGQADAVNYLADKTKKGGVGVWGSVPMPPQNVTDEEAKKLAEWVLSLK
jgi:cytochrome c